MLQVKHIQFNDLMTRLNESDGRGCEDLYALDGGDFREVSTNIMPISRWSRNI